MLFKQDCASGDKDEVLHIRTWVAQFVYTSVKDDVYDWAAQDAADIVADAFAVEYVFVKDCDKSGNNKKGLKNITSIMVGIAG